MVVVLLVVANVTFREGLYLLCCLIHPLIAILACIKINTFSCTCTCTVEVLVLVSLIPQAHRNRMLSNHALWYVCQEHCNREIKSYWTRPDTRIVVGNNIVSTGLGSISRLHTLNPETEEDCYTTRRTINSCLSVMDETNYWDHYTISSSGKDWCRFIIKTDENSRSNWNIESVLSTGPLKLQ